jgi:predicted nuclease of predicted toxin-antitoxin system
MSLTFFIDQCVPNLVGLTLRNAGYEVLFLRDYIPIDSPDPVVINTAQKFNSILVSLNGDFADIISYPPANYQGIISLQIKNHPEIIPQIMSRLINHLSAYSDREDYQGKLLIVDISRIRIRQ